MEIPITVKELREIALAKNIRNGSRMSKAELVTEILTAVKNELREENKHSQLSAYQQFLINALQQPKKSDAMLININYQQN